MKGRHKGSKGKRNGGSPSRSAGRAGRYEGEWQKPDPDALYIAGWNGVAQALASPQVTVRRIWANARLLTPANWQMLRSWDGDLEEIHGRQTPFGPAPQGIAALTALPHWPDFEDCIINWQEGAKPPLVVMLDQVEDPMNLGQIMRTCEGCGVDGLVLPKHRSVHLTQTVAQVSQGAFAWLPLLEVTNLRQAIDGLKNAGFWIIGCDAVPGARLWNDVDYASATVLVFGSEGRGLRDLTRKSCDHLAALPMAGHLNSLNVGAAVAAFVYEAKRQRRLQR